MTNMIDMFKKFVSEEIFNQLCYYDTEKFDLNDKPAGIRFFLTPYADDFEYVKRRVCYFISTWNGSIYVNMNPRTHVIVVEIWEGGVSNV